MNASGILLTVSFLASSGGEMTIASAPPVVVKTVPESGTIDVDAKTKEIRVTFSKPMTNGSWSWNKTPEAPFPKLAGEPRYEKDMKTCVLPVSLEPGKTYALWLNSSQGGNFRDQSGRLAVPYLVVFKTKGSSGSTETRNEKYEPTRSPSNMALQRTTTLPRFARARVRR